MASNDSKATSASKEASDTAESRSAGLLEKKSNEILNNASHKRQKSRHRASVACASCRDRRIRCVVPPGESECIQCKRAGVECVIKNDDERRRPISRAYMTSLTDRITMLERMLREKGYEPPPADHPPKSRHPLPDDDSASSKTPNTPNTTFRQLERQDVSSPSSQHSSSFDVVKPDPGDNNSLSVHQSDNPEPTETASSLRIHRNEGMVKRLLSTRGHLSFDQLSGRLRYFGPTASLHVHSESGISFDDTQETLERAERTNNVMQMLPMESYEYLMDLFWQHYNSVMHVIHQAAFNEDRENGQTQFYSKFLHICVLAMGYRFADKSRPDMQRITVARRESTLHREAKYMLDHELERPGGITLVVSLLLLGDLECGVGRDNLGWMYSGMAVRLMFDVGLHLDSRNSGLPQREVDIRQMTLWACVIYDKYWALFLGRPTSIKSSDLEIYSLAKQFERLGTCQPAGPQKSLETQIYEALIDLMELAGKITENPEPRAQSQSSIDRNAYMRMAALDREFANWLTRLPQPLRWNPENIQNAPLSFFLLHQQYHSVLILLHRPFAKYEDSSSSDNEEAKKKENDGSALSRSVCTKHAIAVSKIFFQHRERFPTGQICITALQHAGTAATALVAALAFLKDSSSRNHNMQYLECLASALNAMAPTYHPAERMFNILQAVVAELRGVPADSIAQLYRAEHSVVPARRGNAVEDPYIPQHYKRQNMNNTTRTPSNSFSTPGFPTAPATAYDLASHQSAVNMMRDTNAQNPDFPMGPPRSELSSWSSAPTLPPSAQISPHNQWMPTLDSSASDIAHLAAVHFPEMPGLMDMGGGGVADHSHLDFMSMAGEDWGEWRGGGLS